MTQDELKKIIHYCPATGFIKRLDRKNGNGSIDHYGYLIIKIKGVQYKSHRLAWLYQYGSMPSGVIDHMNGDKTDNRICNLRDVDQAENCRNANRSENPDTGFKGVYIDSTNGLKKRYATKINSKSFRFYSAEEAYAFRKAHLGNVLSDSHF